MMERRSSERSDRFFTLEQLREDHALVASAAKKDGGCIVIDDEGRELFTLSIPQDPFID